MQLAAFRCDVTPPRGHSLLGGLVPPAQSIADPLESLGVVILGDGLPIVLSTVDWGALANDAHLEWRAALAAVARTKVDRVLLHVVHQHNTPFVCLEAARIVAGHADLPPIVDTAFFATCLERVRQAVARALSSPVSIDGLGTSQARVEKVASNRRFVGPDGRLAVWRPSKSELPIHRSLPEGLIDPWLRTVALYSGAEKVAAFHFYATHPISYYGDGAVTSDFVGLARRKRQADNPRCFQMYFTGCAGDVAAGRYNDGSASARKKLTKRLYRAMRRSERGLRPQPLEHVDVRTTTIEPTAARLLPADQLSARIGDSTAECSVRLFDAFTLSWRHRVANGDPLFLAALHLNDSSILSLPAECFVAYQLRAQAMAPDRFIAVAAYADGGPWYIPTKEAYGEGGYEIDRALCGPETDDSLVTAISDLLAERRPGAPRNPAESPNLRTTSRQRRFRYPASHLWWNRRVLYVDAKFLARNLKAALHLPPFQQTLHEGITLSGCSTADVSRVGSLYAELNGDRRIQTRVSWLMKSAGRRLCLTARTASNGIIAFVLFYFTDRDFAEGTIHEGFIGVSPPFQGRGLASVLRRQAIGHFQKAGLAGISSRISLSQKASMSSGVRLGFKVVERYYDAHLREERAYLKLIFSDATDTRP